MSNFYREVIVRDLRFHLPGRCSDSMLLEPRTRELASAVVEGARAEGVRLMVYETYRSRERQTLLHDRGATKLREVGVHHYGLAFDLVRDVDGEPSWKGSFAVLGRLGRKYGLVWGGDWGDPTKKHSFVDAVHLQRISVARQGDLFRGVFYPDDSYDPYIDFVESA